MLGKLLKYEMKSTSRILVVIYVAILALSCILGVCGRPFFQETFRDSNVYYVANGVANVIPFVLSITGYVILIIAMVVITFFIIIERFYKNMLCGEGYLMHTLPVPTWALVASKLICALIWEALGMVVLLLSLCIMTSCGGVFHEFVTPLSQIFSSGEILESFQLSSGIVVVDAVISAIRMILVFYAAMAIGGSVKKHKIFYSVIAFLVIVIVYRVIGTILNVGYIGNMILLEASGSDSIMFGNRFMIKEMVWSVIYCVAAFGGTCYFLKNKLNLE